MDATVADDKIHAVVSLVLQAVDQRLAPVRDQLAQLTNAMHRSHAELAERIEECQRLYAGLQPSGPSERGGTDEPSAQATAQLIEAANVLTDQVAFLEARVNSYTNNRIAEVKMLIDRAGWASTPIETTSSKSTLLASSVAAAPASTSIAAALIASAPGISVPPHPASELDNIAPAAARLASLSGHLTPSSPSGGVPTTMPAPLASGSGPPPVVTPQTHTLVVTAPASPPDPDVDVDMSDDIARLSAQMSARLAAAVDRALGVSPGS